MTLHPQFNRPAPASFEEMSAQDRVQWAVDTYGDGLVLSTSFGIQSAVLIHMLKQAKPDIKIVFVDTQHHVPETYIHAQRLIDLLGLHNNIHIYRAVESAAWQEAVHGRRWERGPEGRAEHYRQNKIEPNARALRDMKAACWISGLRREQTEMRRGLPFLEDKGGVVKLYPMLDWSKRDVHAYMMQHGLPYHPLWEQGFERVGEIFDTKVDESKGECGLHQEPDYVI